ncbi:MAG: cupin domain-containing protein [Acidimicrobiia bacterium]|nr:cupin domain-containing protein [Acidimicrobiia bacterium]
MNDSQKEWELDEDLREIGGRLRLEREKVGISQRELGRRLGLSGSMISQLESGLSRPSVGTLYGIVTELNLSLDRVIRGSDHSEETPAGIVDEGISPVVRRGERQAIVLASGVRWEELTASPEDGLDFIHATYEVGGASTPDEALMRHRGREYGYVISGTLGVQIGAEEHVVVAGDSIVFDSSRLHRLYNKGDVPVESVWFVVGRSERGSDMD